MNESTNIPDNGCRWLHDASIVRVLFDPGHSLEERILAEQFA